MLGIEKLFNRLFCCKEEIVVGAPPDRVFGCVADIARYGEWLISGRFESTSGQPVDVGSTFTWTSPIRFLHARLKVTEFVPSKSVVWEWEWTDIRLLRSFELQSADDGTLLRYGEEWLHFGRLSTAWALLASPFIFVLIIQLPILRLLYRGDRRRSLRRIQSRLVEPEAGAPF